VGCNLANPIGYDPLGLRERHPSITTSLTDALLHPGPYDRFTKPRAQSERLWLTFLPTTEAAPTLHAPQMRIRLQLQKAELLELGRNLITLIDAPPLADMARESALGSSPTVFVADFGRTIRPPGLLYRPRKICCAAGN